MQFVRKKSRSLFQFAEKGLWEIRIRDISGFKSAMVRFFRIVVMTLRHYTRDNCPLRASALTFYTLLSIVPVLAMAFGIAKGFGLDTILEKELLQRFSGQEEVMIRIMDFSRSLLESTRGGLVAGLGVVLLFWSVIKVLYHIENALNAVWESPPRPLGRKFSDYISIMLLSPIIVIMSASSTVFITTQVTAIAGKVTLLDMVSPLIYMGLKILPFGLIWILFTLIYMVMPNTRVSFYSAVFAGVIAGTFYQFAQGLYINFQILVAKYNAIYGSFAALPLFLIWLQISWLIVLLGAEISYAHQNAHTYEMEPMFRNIPPEVEKRLALEIIHRIVKNFSTGEKPVPANQLSEALDLPVRTVTKILELLVKSELIIHVETPGNNAAGYQPAMDISRMDIGFVLERMENRGKNDTSHQQVSRFKIFDTFKKELLKKVSNMQANKRLTDI